MRVILHIGGHKTGTTYLQHFWASNSLRLSRSGICYPQLYENNAHHVLAAPWLRLYGVPDHYFAQHGMERGWRDLADSVPRDAEVLLLSAENFSRLAPERVDLEQAVARLSQFGPVELVYVWRDPVELVQSIWLERFKSGDNTRFEAMLAEAMRREMATGVSVVPDRMWEIMRLAVPAERIHFLDYGRAKSHHQGLAGAIVDALGLAVDLSVFEEVDALRANISIHPQAAYIAQRFGAKAEDRRRIAADWAPRLTAWASGVATAYSRYELQAARSRFARNEQRLAMLMAEDGRDCTPPLRGDDQALQCRDEIAEEVWLDLARRAFHVA